MNAILAARTSRAALILLLGANLCAQSNKPSTEVKNWFEKVYIDAGSYM